MKIKSSILKDVPLSRFKKNRFSQSWFKRPTFVRFSAPSAFCALQVHFLEKKSSFSKEHDKTSCLLRREKEKEKEFVLVLKERQRENTKKKE